MSVETLSEAAHYNEFGLTCHAIKALTTKLALFFRIAVSAPISRFLPPATHPNAAIKPLNPKLALFFRIHFSFRLCIVPPRTPICQTGESGFGPRLAATPAIS